MATSNITKFEAELRVAEDSLAREVIVFHKRVTLEALNRIVLKNPVLTGRSRGNWQAGTATNETGVADWYTRMSVEEVVRMGAKGLRDLKAYSVAYLWNNVIYIVELEGVGPSGHPTSRQAPQGMVRITLEEMKGMVSRVA